jgi:hypothetical protein
MTSLWLQLGAGILFSLVTPSDRLTPANYNAWLLQAS